MFEYLMGVGAMKAGTTLLYDLLQKHPQIRHGKVKELHYFDHTEHPDKAQYDSLFGGGEGVKMDITPIYMYDPACVEKICRTVDPSRVAVVVLLRDPVERALSHYRMCLSQGQEDRPFEACFDLEPERIARNAHDFKIYSYFSRGLYAGQLQNLFAHFPSENIMLCLFEDFIKNQQEVVDRVCAFVGVAPIRVRDMHSNKSVVHVKSRGLARLMRALARVTPGWLKSDALRKLKYKLADANEKKGVKDPVDPEFIRKLAEYYRRDVETLRDQYGLDTSKWKHFSGAAH